MSHTTKVKAKFIDLESVAKAAERCGGILHRNKSLFTSYAGRQEKCIHAISIKGAAKGSYEIGLRYLDTTQKAFEPHCDFWGGQLAKTFGQDLSRLKTEYAVAVTEKRLKQKGYAVRRVVDEGRHVRLQAIA